MVYKKKEEEKKEKRKLFKTIVYTYLYNIPIYPNSKRYAKISEMM